MAASPAAGADQELRPSARSTDHKTAHEADITFDREAAMAQSRNAKGALIGDYVFTDTDGKSRSLSDFDGRPVLINLIYTSCSHTCPMIVSSVQSALNAARAADIGDQIVVLTIGFDVAVDTPERMHDYQRSRGIDGANWHFLSADQETIDTLTRDVGFAHLKTPHGFEHIAQSSLLGPDRRLFRQIYGANFTPPVLVEPLKALIYGETAALTSIQGLADQLRLFCTVYDPASGRYRFDYSLLITIAAGAMSLGIVGFFLIRAFFATPSSVGTRRR